MSDLKEVFELWTTNQSFKQNFKKNPQQTLDEFGIELDENDLKKVFATIQKQEELEKKINK